jgi:hypothetical protein
MTGVFMWQAACQNNGLHFPLGTLEIRNGLYRMPQRHLACLDKFTVVSHKHFSETTTSRIG